MGRRRDRGIGMGLLETGMLDDRTRTFDWGNSGRSAGEGRREPPLIPRRGFRRGCNHTRRTGNKHNCVNRGHKWGRSPRRGGRDRLNSGSADEDRRRRGLTVNGGAHDGGEEGEDERLEPEHGCVCGV